MAWHSLMDVQRESQNWSTRGPQSNRGGTLLAHILLAFLPAPAMQSHLGDRAPLPFRLIAKGGRGAKILSLIGYYCPSLAPRSSWWLLGAPGDFWLLLAPSSPSLFLEPGEARGS